jgi:hypothetical protein
MSIIQQAIIASTVSTMDEGHPLPSSGFPGTPTVPAAGLLGTPITPTGYQIGDTVGGQQLLFVNFGLFRKKYPGNFVGNASFFDTVSSTHQTVDAFVSFELVELRNSFSMEWCGYVKVGVTGFYNFALRSDDHSGMWIGTGALSGPTYGVGGNHLIDNITSPSVNTPIYNINSVYLAQDLYYPVRIRMQEIGGAELLRLYYGIADGSTPLSGDVTSIVFSNTNITYNGF